MHTISAAVIILFSFLCQVENSSEREETSASLNELFCSNCSADFSENEISADELKKIKLEIIKQQILQKLRLKQAPNVKNRTLPEFLFRGRVLQAQTPEDAHKQFTKDDFYGTTQQIVIFPEKANSYNCYTRNDEQSNGCFRFRLTSQVTTRSVSSAELWIYAFGDVNSTENESASKDSSTKRIYTVIDVASNPQREGHNERVVAIKEISSSSGWIKFDVTATVRTWAMKKHLAHKLEISCHSCSSDLLPPMSVQENQKPFIVVDTDSWKVNRRHQRSITCTDDSTHCCKERFTVDFSDINWNTWIIYPDVYEANFCRGSCLADVSSSRYHHTTVLRRYIQKNVPDSRNITMNLCCTPYIMKPLTLIYIDEDNNIFKATLPNMIVDSCECA